MLDGRSRCATRIGLALGVVMLTAVWWPSPRLDAQTGPFELNGTGAWEVTSLFNLLAAPLSTGTRSLAVNYIARGDRDGRGQLARGEVDFAVSGRPMSGEDQEALGARGVGVIEAPFSLSSIAFLFAAPFSGDAFAPAPIQTITADPNDPDAPVVLAPISEPFRLSNRMLADSFLNLSGPWGNPELNPLNQVVPPATIQFYGRPPKRVARSDPGAMNYHLLDYLRASAPDAMALKAESAGLPTDIRTESWPFTGGMPTRSGDLTVGALVGDLQNPDSSEALVGGLWAPVSASTAAIEVASQQLIRLHNAESVFKGELDKLLPATALYIVAIPNGAGEFLQPTTETLSKAAAAGGGKPLYGLTENVPGAYPLTFVENIYVPNKGLSIDATNAVATLMRVQATGGQDVAALLGEGRLPAALTMTTMLKADEVVQANCKGADRKLVTAPGGGEFWPADLDQPQSSLLCVSASAPAPTSTASSSDDVSAPSPSSVFDVAATSGLGPSGLSGATGSAAYDSAAVADIIAEAVGAADAAGAGADSATATPIASNAELPLPPPSTGRYLLDRLATLLLGGAAFLLVRGLLRGRLAT